MPGFSVIWGMGWGGAAVPNVGCRQLMLRLSYQQPSGLRLPFWTGRECGQSTFRHLCFSFHKDKNIGFSIFLICHPQKQFYNFIFFKNFIYVYNEIRSYLVSSFPPSHHFTPNTLSSQLHVGFFFDRLLSTMSDAPTCVDVGQSTEAWETARPPRPQRRMVCLSLRRCQLLIAPPEGMGPRNHLPHLCSDLASFILFGHPSFMRATAVPCAEGTISQRPWFESFHS